MNSTIYSRSQYLKMLKREDTLVRLVQITAVTGLLGVWELAAQLGWIDPFILSSPVRMVKTFITMAAADLWVHVAYTDRLCTGRDYRLWHSCGAVVLPLCQQGGRTISGSAEQSAQNRPWACDYRMGRGRNQCNNHNGCGNITDSDGNGTVPRVLCHRHQYDYHSAEFWGR